MDSMDASGNEMMAGGRRRRNNMYGGAEMDASGNEVMAGGRRRRNNVTMRRNRRNNMMGGAEMDASGNEVMAGGKRRRNNTTMRRNNNAMLGGAKVTVGTKAQVYHGTAKHTSGGLTKKDLMKTKKGRIVSKKKHAAGQKAIKKLKKLGYVAKKGTFKLFKKH
jgi:hypothetical protein